MFCDIVSFGKCLFTVRFSIAFGLEVKKKISNVKKLLKSC